MKTHRTILVFSLLFPYLSSIPHVYAGSSNDRLSEKVNDKLDISHLGLTPQQQREVFGNLDIISSMTETDCHTSISLRLSSSCTTERDGMVGLHEDDRKSVAISLTLCAISSALLPIPTECSAWYGQPGMETARTKSITRWMKGDGEGRNLAKCLGALHRSPQDWTTYNGYLREATQLCHAISGKREAEIARQTYVNATLEKIALLNLMKQNEESRATRESRLVSDLSEKLQTMQSTNQAAENALRDLNTQTVMQEDNLLLLSTALEDLEVGKIALWRNMERDARAVQDKLFTEIERAWEDILQTRVRELGEDLRLVTQEHSDELSATKMSMEGHLKQAFSDTWERQHQLSEMIMRNTDNLRLEMFALSTMTGETFLNMRDIQTISQDLHPTLISAVSNALELKSVHSELLTSLHNSASESKALSQLAATFHESINDTLSSLSIWKKDLLSHKKRWFGPITLFSGPALFNPQLGNISKPNLAVLSHLLTWVINIISSLLLMCLCGAVSLLASAWLLLRTGLGTLLKNAMKTLRTDDSHEVGDIENLPQAVKLEKCLNSNTTFASIRTPSTILRTPHTLTSYLHTPPNSMPTNKIFQLDNSLKKVTNGMREEITPLYPWNALQLAFTPETIPRNPPLSRKSLGRGSNGKEGRRRCVSEPP
ncbi:hypothetical protein TREMEDRAFT_59976 [Tremella mesenterica DSM 1558]|uniref:uncharacterized protein n=1 Tax=Tremella mesenterica (strain ATCC 24925 / CBS 8224 / DSM 1558 / NBRC 9311 / NRRL Y-6157 / RJB 2259-6 / UBC 559-6) TaxID=578456 RepID=UPI0003F4A33F|nr:uncharacterized protein TREMEDRAFT_59976 [Tremella mesenterica DSM 1558]EIW71032.1 hypothetical protein TREMEDRAFT_59976 [Tremella mesenterica DSM 1558]